MKTHGTRALVTLSGGQDSTTCLYWALSRYDEVRAISFRYNQRHAIELDSARHIARMANVEHDIVDVGPVFAGLSPLTDRRVAVDTYASAAALPGGLEKTFVPGRNILFLTIAANRAYVADCDAVIVGLSQEDYGGYPDCRAEFVEQMQRALALGLDRHIEIVAPLLHLDKRQTVLMAQGLPGCMEALAWSHTCYNGQFPPCGGCHACLLRSRGFEQAGVPDPMIERARPGAAQ